MVRKIIINLVLFLVIGLLIPKEVLARPGYCAGFGSIGHRQCIWSAGWECDSFLGAYACFGGGCSTSITKMRCQWDSGVCFNKEVNQNLTCWVNTCGRSGHTACESEYNENCNNCPGDCGSCCTPSCSPACGQANGCGGNCNNSDGGVPDAPTLDPGDGGAVTIDVDEDVVVSWDPVNKAEEYEYEIYQVGEDCSHATAHCGSQAGTSVSFPALVNNYYYHVRALNSSCATEYSGWSEATFMVNGLVLGQVFVLDDGAITGDPGGFCSLLGGTAVGGDADGSSVSVSAGGSGGGVAGDGTYSVIDVPTGVGYFASLTIGDPANYSCECPSGCNQGGVSSPQAGVNFYLNNFKQAWFQVEGGNLHANSGNVVSYVPDTCTDPCEPYLILGEAGATGAVSYTGVTPEVGEGDLTEDGSDWRMNTEYKGQQTGYGYFNRILEEDPTGVASWGGDKPGSGVYKGEGVGRISGDDWGVVDGEVIVILVPNDLVIDVNIDVDVGGFLAIISSGNISIGDGVTNIQGVYIADGIVATCESSECGNSEGSGDIADEQLTVEGILVGWGGVDLRRNFASADSSLNPSEILIYRPDLQMNAYKYLLRSHYTWEEKAP